MLNHSFATRRVSLVLALLVVAATLLLQEASAQTTCVRAINKVVKGKVVTTLSTAKRNGKCRKGEVAALAGPAGADGQLRVYGDGSSGALQVSFSQVLTDASAMYTDVVIDSGSTFTVPSGTVIRCTGSFTNNGTINVLTGARGGRSFGTGAKTIMPSYALPHPGISARAAAGGESGDTSETRLGGLGGLGLTLYEASLLRYPGIFGGGGGAGGLGATGGKGGGSLVVLCKGAVTNNGTIKAEGEDISSGGAAGGGGGVIILASKTSVTSSAGSSILARGGHGGYPLVTDAPGGGGGGGIIHFIAPAINVGSATTSVLGGPGGTSFAFVSGNPRAGGAGGGASGGNGGAGGSISSGTSTPGYGIEGSVGYVISTVADPTSSF